jgi:hypothetical protein
MNILAIQIAATSNDVRLCRLKKNSILFALASLQG